jgi:hypothetical protein
LANRDTTPGSAPSKPVAGPGRSRRPMGHGLSGT